MMARVSTIIRPDVTTAMVIFNDDDDDDDDNGDETVMDSANDRKAAICSDIVLSPSVDVSTIVSKIIVIEMFHKILHWNSF